jgi:hypothetical protein
MPNLEKSRDGTLMSPQQHRAMAQLIRKHAGLPNAPDKATAEKMAQRHETLAKALERRAG